MLKILKFINKFLKLNAVEWNIGITKFEPDIILNKDYQPKIQWIKHNYKDRWFADPFILSSNEDEVVLLVEEFIEKYSKGSISKMVIDRVSLQIKSLEHILNLDIHLSFPIIYRKNGEVYFYPESAQQNKLCLYRYNIDEHVIHYVSSLISNIQVVDSVMKEIDGSNFIFTTCKPNQSKDIVTVFNGKIWNENYSFYCNIKVAPFSARSAGDFIIIDNKLIRPSQDCKNGYGKGVIFSELFFKNGKFCIEEIKRLYPLKNDYYNEGYHTFNVYNDLAVVDGYRFKKPFFAKKINYFRNILGI